MSQGMFLDILILWEAFKRIFGFHPKIEFFLRVSPGFLVKNGQILKSVFFICLCC